MHAFLHAQKIQAITLVIIHLNFLMINQCINPFNPKQIFIESEKGHNGSREGQTWGCHFAFESTSLASPPIETFNNSRKYRFLRQLFITYNKPCIGKQ